MASFFYINNIKKIVVVVVGSVNLWISHFSFEISKKFFSDNFVDKKKESGIKGGYIHRKKAAENHFVRFGDLIFQFMDQFFNFSFELFVLLQILRYLLTGMNDGGMISSAEIFADV